MAATRAAPGPAEGIAGPAYAAFISYSRGADARLAPRLESALERFAKPWYRLRMVRVFRDDSDLATNPGLWSSLTGALDRAHFFVLLASPAAAASPWVGREVEYWLAHQGADRVLIVLTDGEIVWDEAAGDFEWQQTTALPPALSGAFGEEPRYTDLRFAAASEQLSLRDPRFRSAVADIAAPVHGRAKDELIGEEVRQHRRTMRIARAAGAALALLAAAASVAAVVAIRSADRANRERDRAERAARVATSRQLAAQSTVALRDGQLGSALGQAARAWRTAHTGESRDALLAALKGARGVDAVMQAPRTELAAVSGDRRRVALLGPDNRVSFLDLATRRPADRPLPIRVPPSSGVVVVPAGIALDAHGTRLAVGYEDGSVDLWDLAARRRRALALRGRSWIDAVPVFSADGTRLAWSATGERGVSMWDGKRVRTLRSPQPLGGAGGTPWGLALSADGRFLAATGALSGDTVLWRLGRTRPRVLPGRPSRNSDFAGAAIALGGRTRPVLAVAGAGDGSVGLWDARSGRRLPALAVQPGYINALAFSPRGHTLAVVDRRGVTLFASGGKRLGVVPRLGAERGAIPLDETGRVATIGAGGLVAVRAPGSRAGQIARPLAGARSDTPFDFDRTSSRIAALDAHRRVRWWDPATGRPIGRPLSGPIGPDGLRILPDRRVLTCCGPAGDVRIWDRGGGVETVRGPGRPDDAAVTAGGRPVVARTVGNDVVVTGGARRLTVPGGRFSRLSADGRWATAATTDTGVSIWSVDQGRRAASVEDVDQIAFSPAGPLVAVSADRGPIRVIDRTTGRDRATFGDDVEVAAMEFSPDGRTLATVTAPAGAADSPRALLELWDVARHARVGAEPLLEWTYAFRSRIAFAPDGRRLAVSRRGAPLVFDLDVDDWAARAGRLAAGVP